MHHTVSFTLSVSGFEKILGSHSALTIILCDQLHCAFAAKWPSEGFLGQGFFKIVSGSSLVPKEKFQ